MKKLLAAALLAATVGASAQCSLSLADLPPVPTSSDVLAVQNYELRDQTWGDSFIIRLDLLECVNGGALRVVVWTQLADGVGRYVMRCPSFTDWLPFRNAPSRASKFHELKYLDGWRNPDELDPSGCLHIRSTGVPCSRLRDAGCLYCYQHCDG